jgi:hypothetical protein
LSNVLKASMHLDPDLDSWTQTRWSMDSRSSSICIEKCSKRRLRKMKGSSRRMRGASSGVSLGKTPRRRPSKLAELAIEARHIVQLSVKEHRKKKEPLTENAFGNFKSKPFPHMRQNSCWKGLQKGHELAQLFRRTTAG